jgi:hypothetical protein
MLSRYTTKCKYTQKMIQIISKLHEVLNHILNINQLYHFNYNWKVWLMWFHKKYLDKFFIQMSIRYVEKKIVENLLSFERWQELFWSPLYQNPFYMFIKILDEIQKKKSPNIYQKPNTFSCLKQPPPPSPPHSVLSPKGDFFVFAITIWK